MQGNFISRQKEPFANQYPGHVKLVILSRSDVKFGGILTSGGRSLGSFLDAYSALQVVWGSWLRIARKCLGIPRTEKWPIARFIVTAFRREPQQQTLGEPLVCKLTHTYPCKSWDLVHSNLPSLNLLKRMPRISFGASNEKWLGVDPEVAIKHQEDYLPNSYSRRIILCNSIDLVYKRERGEQILNYLTNFTLPKSFAN